MIATMPLSESQRHSDIDGLALYATEQARRMRRPVAFNHGGVQIVVHPNDNTDDVKSDFAQKMSRRQYR